MKRIPILLLLLCLAMLLPACQREDIIYGFSYDGRAPSPEQNNFVTLRYRSNAERTITFSVNVDRLDHAPMGGAEFDMLFGSDLLEYEEWHAGDFLEEGGGVLYQVELDSADPGRLHVRIVQGTGAEPVVGDGRLIRIKFRVKDEGVTYLDYQGGQLLGAEPELAPMGGILWFGGMLVIY